MQPNVSEDINKIMPSITFRVLNKMKLLNDVQKHGQISFFGFIGFAIGTVVKRALFTYSYKGYFFEPLNKKFIRPAIWRCCGCDIRQENVFVACALCCDDG